MEGISLKNGGESTRFPLGGYTIGALTGGYSEDSEGYSGDTQYSGDVSF